MITDIDYVRQQDADEAFDELYGLSDEIINAVNDAVDRNANVDELKLILQPLHAADVADLLEQLSSNAREYVVQTLGSELDYDTIGYLDDNVRDDIVEDFDTNQLVKIISDLDSDDAFDLIEDLDKEEQLELLKAIPAKERAHYEQSLSFPEDSAGRLIQREVITIAAFWNVGQAIDYMRDDKNDLPSDFYNLIVVDSRYKPMGLVKLSRLLRAGRDIMVSSLMDEEAKIIPALMDQEDAAFLFHQYGLVEATVVDDGGKLVGVITIDDIIDVMTEEREEDMLKLGGVIEDDLYSDVIETTRLRFPWLFINLLTAILAASVIGLFEEALDQIVALAILMPVVASMGGNAGTQTLTVAVRALATNELTATNAMRIVGKEGVVGAINGIIFAFAAAITAWLWFGDPMLGLVIAAAMVINLLAAGVTGAVIPLILDKYGYDPAIASTVFLTTITDIVGFLSFLGLAVLLLL